MPIVKLDTGFNIEIDFPIAPFHKRFFAWLIDLAICWAYIKIVWSLLGLKSVFDAIQHSKQELLISTLVSLPVVFYHLLLELLLNGQSVGKKLLHVQVITEEGGQPTGSQYLIRWMFRMIDFDLLLIPGFLSFVITKKSQRLGDLLAGTIVIDTKTSTSWEDTVFTELESDYKPKYPDVMLLSDKDINTLKSIITTVRKKSDYDLSMRIGERIKSKLRIESDQDSLDFLETLLKDYNYFSTK